MTAGPTTLVGLDGNKVGFNHIGVLDSSGNKAPSVALVDQNGNPLNPATSDGLTSIVNTLGTPAQNTAIIALGTSLASILTAMQDLDGKAATATNQTSQSTVLSNILTALGPLATDADLQAATAKIEAVRALLSGTLNVFASSLPLPAGAATETTLTAIKNLMAAEASISESLWYDPTLATPVYYFRQVINTDGVITYAWKNTDGTTATPNLTNIKPLGANASLELLQTQYDVIAADTGTTIGNTLLRVIVMNLGVSPPVVAAALWINATTGAAISAPTPANIKEVTQDVTIISSVLPNGASTSALQAAANTSLASIDSKNPALVSGRVPVDGSGVTSPISASSLPLPTGASTAAAQTTGNASLATIATNTAGATVAPTPVTGSSIVLSAKVGAGKFAHLQIVNDTTNQMYAVIEDTATTTAPGSGATLAPLRVIEVPAGDGTTANSGTADHAVPFAFVNGCRVLLSTTYRTYTPVGSFTGLISASVI